MTNSKITAFAASLATLVATLGSSACDLGSDLGADDASEELQPRYIPSYTNACRPEDKDTFLAVREHLLQMVHEYEWRMATTMEVCDENSCAPCSAEDNPMLEVLRSADQWGSSEFMAALALNGGDYTDASNPSASPLEVYFAKALAYPWRRLLLGTPLGEFDGTTLVMAQGIHRACPDGTLDCNEYRVAIESFDNTCESLAISVPVDLSESGETLTSLGTSSADFGFEVPLTSELPDPSSFQNVPELEVWLEEIQRVTVEMSDVEVDWTTSANGNVCATVRGSVDASTFDAIADTPTSVDAFADESGRIPTTLSLQLSPAVVIAG